MTRDSDDKKMREYISQQRLEDALPTEIRPLIELQWFEPGEFLCEAGEWLEYFYIIMDGRCKVVHLSEDGKTVVVGYLEPGELNGDIELFNECASLHSVCAICRVAAIAIPRHTFFMVMMQNIAFLQMLCRRFAKKLYQASREHSITKLYPIKTRLARYLIEQSTHQKCDEPILDIEEASQCLGVTERHLRRILVELVNNGVIQKTPGRAVILDKTSLNEMASDN